MNYSRTQNYQKPSFWVKNCDTLLKRWGSGITPAYRERLERIKQEALGELQAYGKGELVSVGNPFNPK